MPRIPTISRAALLKLQAKSLPEKASEAASKTDGAKKKSKKKSAKR